MKKDVFKEELTGKNFTGFVWPSVLMMLVVSLYYTIDSVFVANYAGENSLAALNIAYPVQGAMWAVAVMLGAGASSFAGIELGKGNKERADSIFTFTCVAGTMIGIIMSLTILALRGYLIDILGATEILKEGCSQFLSIFIWGIPFAVLGNVTEFHIRADGRPGFTIFLYVSGGVVHLGLDIILMGHYHMGLYGAAVANVAGLAATAIVGVIYFIAMDTKIGFGRFRFDMNLLARSALNGSPEFFNEAAQGIMIFVFNILVVGLAGETGVAAGAIVMTLFYFFMSAHIGFGIGVIPLISYFFGADEKEKINRIIKYSFSIIGVASILLTAVVVIFAPDIISIYENPGSELYDMAVTGLRIAAVSLLAGGINVFVSEFFTAFGKGKISALISLSRGCVLLMAGLFVFSKLFGMKGIWIALPAADILTLILSLSLIITFCRKNGLKIR